MLLCLVGVPCFRFVVASVYFICFPFLCLLRFIALVGFLLPFVVFGLFPSQTGQPDHGFWPRIHPVRGQTPGALSEASVRRCSRICAETWRQGMVNGVSCCIWLSLF